MNTWLAHKSTYSGTVDVRRQTQTIQNTCILIAWAKLHEPQNDMLYTFEKYKAVIVYVIHPQQSKTDTCIC